MKSYTDFSPFLTDQRAPRDNLMMLLSCVIPRPIAFVSTISAGGAPNLAPFSFFNAVGSNPPALIFSPSTRPDGTYKDTIVNLRAVPEFVINVVPYAIRNEMNDASYAFPPHVNEFEAAGFTPLPSRFVRPFRVAESPVQMECRLIGRPRRPISANICIASCFYIADEILLPDGTVDVSRIDLVERLGGDYSTTRDRSPPQAAPRDTPRM